MNDEDFYNGRTWPFPKTIIKHPGVQGILHGADEGIDYKWNVWLKDGWSFARGRMQGCRTGNFNSVADFRTAEPVRNES